MRFGSLFTGIGGLDLGLERAGMACAWQVENDPYCIAVLEKHWPNVERFEDVRTAELPGPIDLICGGFPCQDLSTAGLQKGIGASRSGLWFAMLGHIAALRPSWLVIENVHHAWRKWVPVVRQTVGAIGYWTIPLRLSAAELGADHQRTRCFVVAHANSELLRLLARWWSGPRGETKAEPLDARWGTARSRLARSDDGAPRGVERRRAIGNAVVVPVAEQLGSAILNSCDHCNTAGRKKT